MTQILRRALTIAVLPFALALAACDDDATGPRQPTDVTFAPSLGVNLDAMTRLESGVYIQTLTAGVGIPLVENDRATVDYTLWLPNGNEVDAGTSATFAISVGSVIDGFRLGMLGMTPGETRLIVIPSALGYGATGQVGIPPHSVLVFRVTLLAIAPPVE